MCDWAYHHEALRKQRVIQRKTEAKAKLNAKNRDHQISYSQVPPNHENPEMNIDYQRSAEQNSKGYGRDQYDQIWEGQVQNPTRSQIRKDLHRREKVLRNNNLVMGPLDAFRELDDPSQTNWKSQ